MKNLGKYIAISFFDISADVMVNLSCGNLTPLANNQIQSHHQFEFMKLT